jgi:predicted ester cyclase
VLPELYQSNAKVYLSSGALEGSDRLRDEFIRPTQIAFPDLHHAIADLVVEDNKVAMRYTGSGTHQGDFDGKAATGKRLNYEGIVIFHMKDNRVAEVWNHSNWPEKFAEL